MARFRHLLSGCALAACVTPAIAQSPYGQPAAQPGYVNPFAPQTDADQLSQQMRQVAANPTDLYALLNAARLSLKVGDTDAAAALYTRAERVNPVHPQVKAGMARLLVQSGRPGAALRKFQEAERLGATLNDFGSDRALAYDLIGDQPRAQREYRALLRLSTDDETTRRYALSLGISGLKEPALALLEPLNRRSDRGAWRARAFVLAMTGDRVGAERIATTMMPPGMAQGLAPFFDRLPRLSATERAFAVNFGETRASPTRIADARLVPSLPALASEPNPFPQVRSVTQFAAADDVDDGKKKKKRRRKEKPEPVRLARQLYVAPLPSPPAPTAIQLAALSASRSMPRSFMPARSSGQVRVLPPPPEAYRGPVTQVAEAPANPADRDEPDFAVAAVSALAGGPSAASAAPSRLTSSPATAPPMVVATRPAAVAGPPLIQAQSPTTSNFSLASSTPVAVSGATGGALVPVTPSSAPSSVPSTSVGSATAATAPLPAGTSIGSGAPSLAAGTAVLNSPNADTTAPTPGFSGLGLTDPVAAGGGSISPAPDPASPIVAAPLVSSEGTSTVSTTAAATPVATATAAITPNTGAPPPPQGARGDDALAAILAGIKVPEGELVTTAAPAATVAPAISGTKLLANIDAKAAATHPVMRSARADVVKTDPTLPKRDARGRFVDGRGRPLLDAGGRPMGPKAAAAWQVVQATKQDDAEKPASTLPKKDARGRFVDAKGKPLLDDRGRPMGPKGAAAWQAVQNEQVDDAAKPDSKLPKKDARGRFVDAKGKPLLDDRGRPMGPKGAAAWQAAQNEKADEAVPAKADPKLPKKDARGQFVDNAGKPLLDARGRPMDVRAAAAWKLADGKKKPDPAKGEPQRFWVQVAGGANAASLGREWSRVSAATPSLKGRQGWTTPLRATNRILTGPFKTSGEAAALVTKLKKEGLSAFMFTSDEGQKVSRVSAK